MGLWDEEEIEQAEDDTDEENGYLADVGKSITLIANLLKNGENREYRIQRRHIRKLDNLIDKELPQILGGAGLTAELDMYKKMYALSDKLEKQSRLLQLKDKAVVGVGGQFSAGKSCFLNSIIGTQILPENQTATTSIATYVVNGMKRANYAYTYYNQCIELDTDAVDAMCHEFQRKYGIGFSGFVSHILVQIESFKYPNVALLDTPGYSKNDSDILEKISDENKAREQLHAVEYLIWLVDIENGGIQKRDIDFIKGLDIDTSLLLVINKSSKKPESVVKEIIKEAKKSLKMADISYFDVIAYDSIEEEEYFGGNGLERFMQRANASQKKREDMEKEINDLMEQILERLNDKRTMAIRQVQDIGDAIYKSTDYMQIQGLIEIYGDLQNEIWNLFECIAKVNEKKNSIGRQLQKSGLGRY